MSSDKCVFGLIEKRVTDDMNALLLKLFIEEDITYAVKTIVPLKVPGIDRFSAIFFQRDTSNEGTKVVRDIIKQYEILSGQRVNFDKSLICFEANVDADVKDTITNVLGVRVASNTEKYLGLPMMVRRKKELLGFIRGYGHEINLCQEKMGVACISLPNEFWRPPDLGFIKLKFDATFQSNSKTSSTAVLARDSKGEIVGAETYLFTDVADAFVAEAKACERILLFALRMGFRCLIVEGDSLMVIKKLKL
ncbi:hypothetical protein PVK06_042760 [Gossypium arboreum]|uniref:RNase H type-1 domain-containing protein n=1 Tax=Gossypium arboreum TaxID=29729 RepID=A0ABR0MLP2_GOSAR|nr:hypothetical protein PVK06_042760 [Gossypium arboreum]